MISRRRFFSLAGRAALGIAALPFVGWLPKASASVADGGIVVGPSMRHEVGGLEADAYRICRGMCTKCGVGPMKYASCYDALDPAVDMQPGDIYTVTGDEGDELKIYTICVADARLNGR